MNFNRHREHDEPEINLVPLIDILLVILIFFAATTSFLRVSHFEVKLPQAAVVADIPASIEIAVAADGRYALNGQIVPSDTPSELLDALAHAQNTQPDAPLLIHADGQSTHAAVVRLMQAAQQAGIQRIHFATQAGQ